MARRNAQIPRDRRIEFRMGINVGDSVEGASIHGEGINVAARLEAMADPGGILPVEPGARRRARQSRLGLGILIFAACSPPNGAPPSRGRHPEGRPISMVNSVRRCNRWTNTQVAPCTLIGRVAAPLFGALILLTDGACLCWCRSLKADATVLLNRCLLDGFELTLEPGEFSSILSITLHEESGWPKQNGWPRRSPRHRVSCSYPVLRRPQTPAAIRALPQPRAVGTTSSDIAVVKRGWALLS